MGALKPTLIRGGLELLYFTGAHRWLTPLVGGVGAILTLHHVRPARPGRFQPNRLLEVTPGFFNRVIKYLRSADVDLVSLDEVRRRLVERDFSRRFVCLTFDDGYRDTLQIAYPLLKAEGIPLAVYVATSFPDRLGELWWLALEAVIANNDRIGLSIDGRNRTFDCETVAEKRALYDELYWWLRARPTEIELREVIRNLAACYHVDIAAFCKTLCMSWQELAKLAADPLVTIGAHTVSHPMLAKLPENSVRSEIDLSRSGDRSSARQTPRASGVSGRRPDLGRTARVRYRGGTWFQDRCNDAPGRAVSRASRPSHGAAAHFAQRRIPAPALCPCAAVGFGDRGMERLPRLGSGISRNV